MFKIVLIILYHITLGSMCLAQHKGINFQAVIRSPANTYPTVAGLTATVQILSPDNCVLREEQHSNVNIANGYLNLVLGGVNSTASGGHNPNPILTLNEVFNNSIARSGLTCVNADNTVALTNQTYTPTPSHARKMRLSLTIPGEGLVIADFNMRSVPFAENAEMLAGKAATDFIQIDGTKNVTQANLNNFFSNGNFANINSILSGTYNAPTATNVSGIVAIANGGTGATTQTGAINALLPTQTANAGKYLTTDGTNVSWSVAAGGGATGAAGGDLTGTYPNPTLTTSGVVAGTYGATNKTINSIQVDAKGRITNITDSLVSVNGNQITAGTIGTSYGGTGLSSLGTADQILGMNGAATGYEFKTVTAGAGITITNAANSITITATGGGGGGGVSSVTSANADIAIANTTTTPVLTLNSGTAANQIVKLNASAALPAVSGGNLTNLNASNLSSGTVPYARLPVGTLANTVAAGDDSRFTDSRAPSGAAGGDLSGTYPNPTVAKIQGRTVDSALPADGQALLWDNANTTWKPQYVRMQDIRTSWGGTQMIPSSSCAINEAMVWSVVTDRFTCQSIALNATAITAGVIDNARLPDSAKYWSAASSGIAYTGGNITVAGSVQVGTDTAACAAGNSGALRFNGGVVELCNGTAWTAFTSGAGSGTVTNVSSANADISVAAGTTTPVLTLNTGTAAGQIVKLDGTAKLPAIDGSQLTNLQVSQIPNLDAAKITSGTLPIARGGTNSTTALNNNRVMISSGGAIVESSISATELSYLSGVTSAVQTQLDAKISSNGWANYSVISTNGAGALTAVNSATANTMLQWTLTGPAFSSATYPSSTTANQLLYSSAADSVTGLATANNAVLTTNGSGVPSWSVLSNDTFTQYALLAGRTGGQTLIGGTAANNNLILESTSNSAKGYVVLQPNGGNVGIGTMNPGANLHVVGATAYENNNNSSSGPTFSFWKSRNYAADQSGDELGFISFYGHDGTGIYRSSYIASHVDAAPASGTHTVQGRLGFFTTPAGASDATERMRIDSAGKVGIGTTTPQAGLDIATTGAAASAMIVPRDTVANRPVTPINGMIRYASDTNKFEAYENGAWTNLIGGGGGGSGTVTSVGLSLPAEITVTNSPVTTSGTLTGAWASQSQKTFFAAPNAANGAPSFRTIAASDLPAEGGDLSGSYGSATVVKLQNRTLASTAPSAGAFLKWNGTLTQWEPGAFATCNGASQVLHYSSATDTWTCDTVSVTSASGTLPIANGGTGATTANDALNALVPSQVGNSGKFLTTDGTTVSWAAGGGGGGSPGGANTQIQFNNNGSFGGSANLTWDNTANSFTVTGDISYTGILTDTSDRRLKTDIHPLDASSVVEKLAKVNTYSFRMKQPSNAPVEYGVMAQEVEEIFPELVRTANNEMKTKSVNYIGFIAPLIAANRQLQRELASEKAARMEMEINLKEVRQESHLQMILTGVAFLLVMMLGSFVYISMGRIAKVKEDKAE